MELTLAQPSATRRNHPLRKGIYTSKTSVPSNRAPACEPALEAVTLGYREAV